MTNRKTVSHEMKKMYKPHEVSVISSAWSPDIPEKQGKLKSAVNVLEQATDLNAINPPQNVSVKAKVLRILVRLLGLAGMIGLFLWQASVSVEKYQSKLTSLQERLSDNGKLMYPSITFCTKYIWQDFPGVMEIINNNKSINYQAVKNYAIKSHWSRDKVFSFFSHNNVDNMTYPCNTVGGSMTGRPCSFPFIYQSIVDQSWENESMSSEANTTETTSKTTFLYFDECTPLDDVTPWCYTRTDKNKTFILGQWGYCSPDCTGQLPRFDSAYNIANNPQYWEVGLFDLSTWGSGLCHTYNPPGEVEPGVTGQLYALLGEQDKIFAPMRFLGYNIFIHDKGQFFPGLEMGRIGLSDELFLPKDIEWEGTFQMKQKTLINKKENPCSEDPEYSFRDCVMRWVSKNTGCHLDWFSNLQGEKVCSKRADITKYSESLTMAQQARWLKLSNMTGCIPKCTVRSYTLVEKSSTEADWGRNWSASFYLSVKTSSFISQNEFFAFDIWDLTSGIGGLMGLFVGGSFLSLIFLLYMALENCAVKVLT
ncbi:uncharacterized protein LOC111703419 [Eurytemora carolleeae]|uniref:uncharacterized protein LOC111703419 n=1 Tax=Eurytemora carolleeae TaxID=1294199 RepID=UPI000C786ABC|nr:uncharacterized protein LOC111703419 [Eurytemora carolleeae]|eukprot:XP_023331127.1 uncharacterized protein LOC111703419 [Eurytemora affinis]